MAEIGSAGSLRPISAPMNLNRLSLPFAFCAVLPVLADETVPLPDAKLEPPSDTDFEALRVTSPFTRVLSLPETYALRGVATIGGAQVATLYNRETKKSLVVTPEGGNEAGLSLVEVLKAADLAEVTAKVSFAGEEVELKYESSQIAPQPSGGQRSSGGRSSDGERRGPSPQEIERFRALPEEKQAKLREYVGHVMRNHSELSREERGNLIRGAMMRLTDGGDIEIPAASSQGARGSSSPQRTSSGSDRGSGERSGDRGSGERGGGDRRERGGDSRERR